VVGLVAEGLTNPQIGECLFVSRRTVQTHLGHVFAKLGIASRTQLAAEATRCRTSSQNT
jgi:DNA-binding CsgD family transcriptional regulator